MIEITVPTIPELSEIDANIPGRSSILNFPDGDSRKDEEFVSEWVKIPNSNISYRKYVELLTMTRKEGKVEDPLERCNHYQVRTSHRFIPFKYEVWERDFPDERGRSYNNSSLQSVITRLFSDAASVGKTFVRA